MNPDGMVAGIASLLLLQPGFHNAISSFRHKYFPMYLLIYEMCLIDSSL